MTKLTKADNDFIAKTDADRAAMEHPGEQALFSLRVISIASSDSAPQYNIVDQTKAKIIVDYVDTLKAHAKAAVSVEVKKLEWEEARFSTKSERFVADSIVGQYEVLEWACGTFGGTLPSSDGEPGVEFTMPTLAAAKAAAQADYETRILSALSTKLQEPVGETQSVEEVVCATCSRHIMTDPQPATGWLAACGNRLTRIDECKNSNGCSVQSSLNRAFVEDCLRNYAALIIDGRIDGAGHYLHEDIIEQADIIQVEPSLEKAKDALEAIDAEYSITGQCKELLDEALATLAHQPAKAGLEKAETVAYKTPYFETDKSGKLVPIIVPSESAPKIIPNDWKPLAALKSEGRNDG